MDQRVGRFELRPFINHNSITSLTQLESRHTHKATIHVIKGNHHKKGMK